MIRSEVRLHEVLGDPLGDVVRRKIGEDATCDRSQVSQRGHRRLRHRLIRAVAGVAGLDRLQDQPLHVERGVVDWKAERFGVGQVLPAACRDREVTRPGGKGAAPSGDRQGVPREGPLTLNAPAARAAVGEQPVVGQAGKRPA
jgi:hypothetical protein